ncbi:MAG: hypothetical protein NTY14_02415 [Candidatus Omnitrophica bacterium]|nr:hypothetical protein [Candidatus Omnitrophota bacterium]
MKTKKTPGQVVVIITIFIAVIILLTIVLINISKVSDIKTSTSQIADSGTLQLASQWSQYINELRDTLRRKLATGFGCGMIGDTQLVCFNWGLILPLFGVLLALVLAFWSRPLSLGILILVANPLWGEINFLMKAGFSNAAAQMTEYSSLREGAIGSMLEQAQTDQERATLKSEDVYQYILASHYDKNGVLIVDDAYIYDLTNTPEAPILKGKQEVPRYVCWYWADRHRKVTEAGLGPEIALLINNLVKVTEFNKWDTTTWMYTEVSLKVDALHITCDDGACPDWAVPDKQIVRIISHVTANEPTDIWQWFWQLITGNANTGFLPQKFTELTTRLLAAPVYAGYVTWTNQEIGQVSEVLRGFLLRDMELLNLPVSGRIPTLGDWLPIWYNKDNPHDPDTIYGRLYEVVYGNPTTNGILAWRTQLEMINADVSNIVPLPNGDCLNGTGTDAYECASTYCCKYNDSGQCICYCCPFHTCTWFGNYCSCNPELYSLGLCGHGDLYSTISPPCPLRTRSVYCPCNDCGGPHTPSSHAIQACRFQGELNWATTSGPSEIAQAIELLVNLETSLRGVMDAIETFANAANKILYPDTTTEDLQKEAIYGWVDEKNHNYHIAQVLLDNYPSRDKFPYIKEGYDWGGLLKTWTIKGQLSGSIGDITVSRYTNDIAVGPWWTFRYRRNPAGPEWPINDLSGIIDGIQRTGAPGSAASGLTTYGITSRTKGHYGMSKDDIYIQREQ